MMKRGDVYYADLSPVIGSEQGGIRPVLILQNNIGNRYSPTVIVAAITSKLGKSKVPTHVSIGKDEELTLDSAALLEQIRTIDKQRLTDKITHLSEELMSEVDAALKISLGLK
ncbi:MAG: type II toxin-antitoxin system PemK/MazF family toxin [Atopostipes suicloacalis]|nr:type II toxin-antitoxin system PemK/MazF family toxin [Atopostipes suicloacalis]